MQDNNAKNLEISSLLGLKVCCEYYSSLYNTRACMPNTEVNLVPAQYHRRPQYKALLITWTLLRQSQIFVALLNRQDTGNLACMEW